MVCHWAFIGSLSILLAISFDCSYLPEKKISSKNITYKSTPHLKETEEPNKHKKVSKVRVLRTVLQHVCT